MPIVAHLNITLDDQGQVQVAGTTDNPFLAYGLLGCARDMIAQAQKTEFKGVTSRIELAPGPLKMGLPGR